MRFTLKQLRYFVVAGEFSSVTRAAQELHVSQPSISSAILHLEEVTGLQLFVRHHAQGLSLTPSGRQFIVKAKQLLGQADGLAHYATTLGQDVAGSLRIVGFPTFTPILVPGLIRRFNDMYPAVNVQCDEKSQQDVIQGLHEGRYELALTYDLQIPSHIEFEPLMEFPPYAVMSQDHPLADRDEVSLQELAEHPMVVLDWPMSREYFFSLFLSQGVEPNFAFQAKSMDMVRGLVANGFGYSLFNVPLINTQALDGRGLTHVPVTGELRPLRMGVARLAQFRLTPAAEAFIEELTKEAKQLSDTVFTDSRFYRSLK
ncbi:MULTISPECIES: LysR family transcriptional regulator [Oceanimonas]|uniref:LysR family transcriptional regulator n=1 Tax=Oceanimonas smirnovii TaxID=264574 RepID=A0ABW7NZW7_9GAMM|nr:LysR family transcriptional regulator [Oceanimonas sp. CAM02]MDV2857664.1 LysR family transcriptional regulator [Oceanimonas sp. CAM02]